MKRFFILVTLLLIVGKWAKAQSNGRPHLSIPLIDIPYNLQAKHRVPSMYQATEWSGSLYEVSFYGLDKLTSTIYGNRYGGWLSNGTNYALGLVFSKYGSELPIPLGTWGHEEFHRAVLGINGIESKNGNWLLHRWDGTVYGPTDEDLSNLKSQHPEQLLYSYVAGVQYETHLTSELVKRDFYDQRKGLMGPLYLFNAYYVWNYFRFATSAVSDSVKVIAPKYESKDPSQRDFAGSDLTAWAYDMFLSDEPFSSRDDFPDGQGENRRVGFHDLPHEAQAFLIKQKRLSLLNFLNPAILNITRIKITEHFELLPFIQYQPTHFGNMMSLKIPFRYREQGYFLGITRYANLTNSYYGLEMGRQFIPLHDEVIVFSAYFSFWRQPIDLFSAKSKVGGSLTWNCSWYFMEHVAVDLRMTAKTDGLEIGNPYLDKKISTSMGIRYRP